MASLEKHPGREAGGGRHDVNIGPIGQSAAGLSIRPIPVITDETVWKRHGDALPFPPTRSSCRQVKPRRPGRRSSA